MLDVQRERHFARRTEIAFTRKVLGAHIALGWLIPALLTFHELFFLGAAAALWLLCTFGLIVGVTTSQDWCRLTLGLLFVLFSIVGTCVLAFHIPDIQATHQGMLTIRFLPVWGVIANGAYLIGGGMLIASSRIRKAVSIGFTLW